jgi:hypothetical protein
MNPPDKQRMDLKEINRIARSMENGRGPGNLMKIAVAAYLADLHPCTIRRWIREGRVKAWGYRGTLRVCLDDLLPARDKEGSQ